MLELGNAVFAVLIGFLLFFALGWYLGKESGRFARAEGRDSWTDSSMTAGSFTTRPVPTCFAS